MKLTATQETESRRIAQLLYSLVKISGRSMRSIEQELGLGSSSLLKVLNGRIQLQFGHILKILDALEITPAQFFQVAYSERARPSKLIEQLLRYEHLDSAEKSEDSEAYVRRVVLQMFAEFARMDGAPHSGR